MTNAKAEKHRVKSLLTLCLAALLTLALPLGRLLPLRAAEYAGGSGAAPEPPAAETSGSPALVPGSPSLLLDPSGARFPFGPGRPLEVGGLDLASPNVLFREIGGPAGPGYDYVSLNADAPIFPASMTKLMTALLVLEALEQGAVTLEQKEETSWSDLEGLYEQGASVIGLEYAEEMSVKDLLYATLLASANDAAQVLTHCLSDHPSKFVELMNARAAELGMRSSHFVNVTGLHADGHYSSLNDIALLFETCLKHPLFLEILGTPVHHSAPSADHPEGLEIRRTLEMYAEAAELTPRYIRASKTGYTEEAGNCLVSYSTYGARGFIAVTSAAEAYGANVADHEKLYAFAFEEGEQLTVLHAGEALRRVEVEGGEAVDSLTLTQPDEVVLPFARVDLLSRYRLELALPAQIKAPVMAGDALGQLSIHDTVQDGAEVYKTVFRSASEIKQSRLAYVLDVYPVYLGYALLPLFFLLMLFLVLRSYKKRAPAGRRRAVRLEYFGDEAEDVFRSPDPEKKEDERG